MLDIIKGRRSIRNFTRQKLDEQQINLLLEAARWAPSAGNVQPWHFYVVQDDSLKSALSEAALFQEFIAQAPVVIVVAANLKESRASYGGRGEQLYCIQDTAAAIQNILLMAHSLGLGSCWVGAFNESAVAKTLKLDSHLRPVAIIPLGYPAEHPVPPVRKPISRVVTYL